MKLGLKAFETSLDGFFHKNEGEIPGLAVIIRNSQGVLFNKTYGVQDRETGEALRKDAIYPVASQSKTFTAIAVLKLVEQGQLDLDQDLTEYLSEPSHAVMKGITLRDALAHKTGFVGFWPKESSITTDELRQMEITDDHFEDNPRYSNGMYAQLGLVVENASGMSFQDFVQTEILDKHGIEGVYPSYGLIPESAHKRIAKGYNDHPNAPDECKVEQHQDAQAGTPACGVFATTAGISDFYHKIFSGQVFSKEFMDHVKLLDREHIFHGLGISLLPSGEKTLGEFGDNPLHIEGHDIGNIMGHAGSQNGYVSDTRYNEHTGLTVSVVRTRSDEEPWDDDHYIDLDTRLGPKVIIQSAFQEILDNPKVPEVELKNKFYQTPNSPT